MTPAEKSAALKVAIRRGHASQIGIASDTGLPLEAVCVTLQAWQDAGLIIRDDTVAMRRWRMVEDLAQ